MYIVFPESDQDPSLKLYLAHFAINGLFNITNGLLNLTLSKHCHMFHCTLCILFTVTYSFLELFQQNVHSFSLIRPRPKFEVIFGSLCDKRPLQYKQRLIEFDSIKTLSYVSLHVVYPVYCYLLILGTVSTKCT